MGELNVDDYLIITDVTKVNGLEDMLFVSWFPYKIESITKDNTAVIKNDKHTFIFTPPEMQYVIKANDTQIEKAFTKFKKGDKLIVPDVNRLVFGETLDITSGKEYEVYDVEANGLPIIKDDFNGRLGFLKEDLLFINRIETTNKQVEGNFTKIVEQYKVGDSVVLTNVEKIVDAKGLRFYFNTPYEIVRVLKQIKTLIIKNNFGNELVIYKENLKYIKPYIDTKMIEEVHNFIDELETKYIKNNLRVMIDEALDEGKFDRVKEIVDMGLKFE